MLFSLMPSKTLLTWKRLPKRISFRSSLVPCCTTANSRSLRNSTWRTGTCTTDWSSGPLIVLERKIKRLKIRFCLISYSFKVSLLSLAFRGARRITSALMIKSKVSQPFSSTLRTSLANKLLQPSWVTLIRKCWVFEKISNNTLLKAPLLNPLPLLSGMRILHGLLPSFQRNPKL